MRSLGFFFSLVICLTLQHRQGTCSSVPPAAVAKKGIQQTKRRNTTSSSPTGLAPSSTTEKQEAQQQGPLQTRTGTDRTSQQLPKRTAFEEGRDRVINNLIDSMGNMVPGLPAKITTNLRPSRSEDKIVIPSIGSPPPGTKPEPEALPIFSAPPQTLVQADSMKEEEKQQRLTHAAKQTSEKDDDQITTTPLLLTEKEARFIRTLRKRNRQRFQTHPREKAPAYLDAAS
uniref:Nuclear transcription factor Y subunit n=1 Tax=Chromera velia CCMP2878 TaxID=1169474 RepID=A0A0G4GB87_9ALVE|eukprot:Cvel_21048.t1-p1 / transcript=Cvel_21048.t1 / gene=Cvel_21048 / organism=Chromera_velia_CCMP2878 / gene_product=hypothetical protein / transcript_product=hypothetical protein / location=Cvel_scaffold1943:28864-29547(+) / protein_length=228 / sequence_SO=supercontig / SO=protein_coding / is_pseudo=false